MNTVTDKVIERARKLYAMSQDSSSPAEAEIALRRVTAMMAEHGITAEDLAQNRSSFGTGEASKRYKAIPTWYGVLAMGVAKYHDCKLTTMNGRVNYQGFDKDALVAPLTLDYLIEVMERGVKAYQKANPVDRNDSWSPSARQQGSSFRNAYSSEMQTIMYRLASERQREQQNEIVRLQKTSPGNAIALIVQKKQMVEEEFGKQRTCRAKMNYASSGASNAGRSAAQNTRLNSQVTGSGQARLS